MSLSLSLNNALSGLRVNRESLAILSQNIANANNPNYSRKVIDQSAVVTDGRGTGVNITDVSRKIDTYLQMAVREQTSVTGRADTLSDYAGRLQILLGNPTTGNDISTATTNLFNAMQSLAETPERSSSRLNVVNVANQFATQIHTLVDGVQGLRFDADQEISTAVRETNIQLRELHNINAAISNANAMNRPVSELLDKRDLAIKEISKNLDVNIFTRPDDTVRVYAKGGAILLDEYLYEVEYTPASSVEAFTNKLAERSPISVYRLDDKNNRIGGASTIASGGISSEVTTPLESGKIKALIDVRDDKMPQILEQLDMFASRMRDEINALHNAGSGYPGAKSLTGTRAVKAGEAFNWEGNIRFALTDINGKPLPSPYSDETSPMRALNINLGTLDSGLGDGTGYPNVQTMINEINEFYGVPQTRVELGDLNNIRLSSLTQKLPASYLDFDFDLENISGNSAKFFVTNATVRDDTGTDITSVTNTAPQVALNATGTYSTTNGSNIVTIAADAHGLADGDYIYLPPATTNPGGIANGSLSGYFQVSEVTANSFKIVAASEATSTATVADAGITGVPAYSDAESGGNTRTGSKGYFHADLGANLTSSYYDVSVNVGVQNADGTISTSTITYRVNSEQYNLYNKRYGATVASGDATLNYPNQLTTPYARALLVDADGRELKKVNGQYQADEQGYLKIETIYGDSYLNIDSMDSKQNGNPNTVPLSTPGTYRGFSHYFELNNFFNSNAPIATGDTLLGSAKNLSVVSRIMRDPSQVTTGTLTQIRSSANPSAAPYYAYERISGDNRIIQRLSALANNLVTFDGAGGLSASNQTLNGYSAEILGFAGADATSMDSNSKNSQVILNGFIERSSAISGVNLDEELANTIIYQNAYSASARIITVTDQLFKDLLGAF